MGTAYQENGQYFKAAYKSKEYHWAKSSCAVVEQYLDFILHKEGLQGAFLDIGCGEGANVRMAAQKGMFAVGLDREPLAVQSAQYLACQEGLNSSTHFLHTDALVLPFMPQAFAVILDHGCFHHLRKRDWRTYKKNIDFVLRPYSWYILEVFSTEHRGYGEIPASHWHIKAGAYRRFFTKQDIEQCWGTMFTVVDIQEKRGSIAGDWHALMCKKR